MLAMISSIAFVVSSLVYRNVTVERSYNDAITSFYAAESGVERGLDIAGIHRKAGQTMASVETSLESFATSGSPKSLTNSKSQYWIDTALTGAGVSAYRAPATPFYQVELYNPDSTFSYLGVESLRFNWNRQSTCSATGRIEVSFFKFNSTSIGRADDLVYKQVFTCGSEASGPGYDCQATSNYPTINTNYVVSVWSMDCSLIDLNTVAYSSDNASGSVVSIPSIFQISAIGTGDQTRREITATIKWVANASGLGQFVLFGETAITK